ncbi:unnamed protein product [Oikopleura dioica]|uniref:Uncharacterized protein n=1 Tax=Oikopleura dioica TaxID=34765 RepID=E4WQD7_OIKDI|nr:unnamed protein product [Oikopleura dioica]
MHRHTKSFKQGRTLTNGFRAATFELQAALQPGRHIQYEDVANAESQFIEAEQDQEWLRTLQRERLPDTAISPETTILTPRDLIYGPPPPAQDGPGAAEPHGEQGGYETEWSESSEQYGMNASVTARTSGQSGINIVNQGSPVLGLLPYRHSNPVLVPRRGEEKQEGILMRPFLIPHQYQMYRTAWEFNGCARSFWRVGVPYSETESIAKASAIGSHQLADFDSGILQRFDAVTSRLKLEHNWNQKEMDQVRSKIEQMLESFNPGSIYFRHDLMEISSYVRNAAKYSNIVGFSALSGKVTLKQIEGGQAKARANKPENLQSLVYRLSRFDIVFSSQRMRALCRMFLGLTRSELPAHANLISPQDFHSMTSKATVLPKDQQDAFLISVYCEGMPIGSLIFVGSEKEIVCREDEVPLSRNLFEMQCDLRRLRGKVPVEQYRYNITDREGEKMHDNLIKEHLRFSREQVQRVLDAQEKEDFYAGIATMLPDMPISVLRYAFYAVRQCGHVALGEFLHRAFGIAEHQRYLEKIHYELRRAVKARRRLRRANQAEAMEEDPHFTVAERLEVERLKADLRSIGLEMSHPPHMRYWKIPDRLPSTEIEHTGFKAVRPRTVTIGQVKPGNEEEDSGDTIYSFEVDTFEEPVVNAENEPNNDGSSVDPVVGQDSNSDAQTTKKLQHGHETANPPRPRVTSTCAAKLELLGLRLRKLSESELEDKNFGVAPSDEDASNLEQEVFEVDSQELNDSLIVNYDPLESGRSRTDARDLELQLILEAMELELNIIVPMFSDDPEVSSTGYSENPYRDNDGQHQADSAADFTVAITPWEMREMRDNYLKHSQRRWIRHLAMIGWPAEKIKEVMEKRHVPFDYHYKKKAPAKEYQWWEKTGAERKEGPPDLGYELSDFAAGLEDPRAQSKKEHPLPQPKKKRVSAYALLPSFTRPFDRRSVRNDQGFCPEYCETLIEEEECGPIQTRVGTHALWRSPLHNSLNPEFHRLDARRRYCIKKGNKWITPPGTLRKILNDYCQPRNPGTYLRDKRDATDKHYLGTGETIFNETTDVAWLNRRGEIENKSLCALQITHVLMWAPTAVSAGTPPSWAIRMSDGDCHGTSPLEYFAEFVSTISASSRMWSYSEETDEMSLDTASGSRRGGTFVATAGSANRDKKTRKLTEWPCRFGSNMLLMLLIGGGRRFTLEEGEKRGLSEDDYNFIRSQQEDAYRVRDKRPNAKPWQTQLAEDYVAPTTVGTYRLERDSNGKPLHWTLIAWEGLGFYYRLIGYTPGNRSGQQVAFTYGRHLRLSVLHCLYAMTYYFARHNDDIRSAYVNHCNENGLKIRKLSFHQFRFPSALLPEKWATYLKIMPQMFGANWATDLQNMLNLTECENSLMRPFYESSYGAVVDEFLGGEENVSESSNPDTGASSDDTDGIESEEEVLGANSHLKDQELIYRVDAEGRLVLLQHDDDLPDQNGKIGWDYGHEMAIQTTTHRSAGSEKFYSTLETSHLETL